MTRIYIVVLTSLLVTAGPAAARLSSQRVLGTQRVCSYPNPNASRQRTIRYVYRRVGSGEPCPVNYPGPERVRPSQVIPAMATLVRQRTEGGQVICEYGYLGRVYPRAKRIGESCPLPPHFVD